LIYAVAQSPEHTQPVLPEPRGTLTDALFARLRRAAGAIGLLPVSEDRDDRALALYVLYELHYRGFALVDAGWEWEPSLLEVRARLERELLAEISGRVGPIDVPAEGVVGELLSITNASRPSLSAWCEQHATLAEMREFAIHRSAYQAKEADPHTWAVPRLTGRSKAALVEIQYGEYGNGRAPAMHAELFADTMRALHLDATYGAYLDRIPAETLDTVNLVSLFGLHRRWRGALIGHLALFEMCSVVPMARYSSTLRRLGVPAAAPFYDVHVEADEYHAPLALQEMVCAFVAEEPQRANDVVFGARALDEYEAAFANRLLTAWTAGRTSLRSC